MDLPGVRRLARGGSVVLAVATSRYRVGVHRRAGRPVADVPPSRAAAGSAREVFQAARPGADRSLPAADRVLFSTGPHRGTPLPPSDHGHRPQAATGCRVRCHRRPAGTPRFGPACRSSSSHQWVGKISSSSRGDRARISRSFRSRRTGPTRPAPPPSGSTWRDWARGASIRCPPAYGSTRDDAGEWLLGPNPQEWATAILTLLGSPARRTDAASATIAVVEAMSAEAARGLLELKQATASPPIQPPVGADPDIRRPEGRT